MEFHPMEHPATVQMTQEKEQRASGEDSADESFHGGSFSTEGAVLLFDAK